MALSFFFAEAKIGRRVRVISPGKKSKNASMLSRPRNSVSLFTPDLESTVSTLKRLLIYLVEYQHRLGPLLFHDICYRAVMPEQGD